ncbi:ArgE/DapE family deacylase [Alkalicoccus chagannorensis]|uniref:ArgE/DapE family deacylase n=1 Tax=Alkalicoccus chagannorensis TaxID=427072 RepID=UPI00040A2AA6|nr:ArgE/DapE family deacylase [Alkalicoccus chagannorensis]
MTEIKQDVQAQLHDMVDADWEEQVEFLKEITRFPSLSGQEADVHRHIASFLEKELHLQVDTFGLDIDKIKNLPGYSPVEWTYENSSIVVGKHEGSEGEANSLIFQGHTDVVSPEPSHLWKQDPYDPWEENGRLYGRGAADMKAGLTAFLFAYRALYKAGWQPKSNLMMQFVPDEERTGNGALAALHEGYTAKAALIPEPFGMFPANAQVGSLWFRVKWDTIKRTEDGHVQTNAIEKSQVIISRLHAFVDRLNKNVTHPAFAEMREPIELNIGKIQSGDFESNEPVTAKMEGRIGVLPGETVKERQQQMQQLLAEELQDDEWFRLQPPEIEFYGFHAEATVSDDEAPIFQALDTAHETVVGEAAQRRSLPSTTDARFFQLYYDIDTVCYGPTGGCFHEIDEWVDLESLKQVTKVYTNMIISWCGIEPINNDPS